MLQTSSRFPGYIFLSFRATNADQGEYQVMQRFATQMDLDRWDNSPDQTAWHKPIRPVAERGARCNPVNALEVWFPPKPTTGSGALPSWKLTLVSWLGIFPTTATCLAELGPVLRSWSYRFRMTPITAVVAFLMAYVVLPGLSAWMRWWLENQRVLPGPPSRSFRCRRIDYSCNVQSRSS